MHDIFIIKELLEHILSFVPRNLIIPCAFTCKRFHDAIKIDHDQDSVAKNSDMFSLLKIPYSSKAIINIAAKYKNNDIIEYLLNKNMHLLCDFTICEIIGHIGNEILLEKLTDPHLSFGITGLCGGLQFELFEKYKHKLSSRDVYEVVRIAYKTGCYDMINNVLCHFTGFWENGMDITDGKMVGLCARENETDVLLHVKNLLITTHMESYNISIICDGLIEGEHYDTFIWFLNEEIVKNNGKYACKSDTIMECLIINNNFKMFCYVITNNCAKWSYNGYYVVMSDSQAWFEDDYLDFCNLVDACIDYRRIDMLTFLINHIRFNLKHYQQFLDKSQLLKFDDVSNVLITNSHLFMEYSL